MKISKSLLHISGRTKTSPEKILLLKADVNYTQVLFSDGSNFLSSIKVKNLLRRTVKQFNNISNPKTKEQGLSW